MKPTNPLFSDKYLSTKFQVLELSTIRNLEEKFEQLRIWKESIRNQSIIQGKEESLKGEFLAKFFGEVLNYSTQKDSGEWFLEIEQKTPDSKKMDGALGFFKIENKDIQADVRVVIEIKDAKTDLDKPQSRKNDHRTPVQQAFDYANSLGGTCRWIIVSNFLELRLYYQTDRTRYQYFDLQTLDYKENFKQFYFLLNKDRLIARKGDSITDKLYFERQAEELTISKKFYADYKQARLTFFNSLKIHHPKMDELVLLNKTQKLLDRLLFVHFCEDYNIIESYTLRNLITNAKKDLLIREKNKIYIRLCALFSAINHGYPEIGINKFNGGLFEEDELLNNLVPDDTILKPILALIDYDFASDLNVNILGHIFEQSISDIEELKADISGEQFDKKQGKRKKEGIYYTPDYITRYIVEEAIGGWLKEKRLELNEETLPELTEEDFNSIRKTSRGKNKLEHKIQQHLEFYEAYKKILSKIKVLDPACGSGAFLNQAFDFLYAEGQRVNHELVRLRGGQIDSFDLNKHILENNLFGVDLNQESVEITKLSLWLKTANAHKELTSLDNNIKCGNSLIDDEQVAGNKVFIWEKEFKQIIEQGGFDVIIGNPPYGAKLNQASQQFLLKKYDLGSTETAILFIKKGFDLLKQHGKLSFIIPKSFLFASNYKKIRQFLFNNISAIVDCKKVWQEVLLEQTIILFDKTKIFQHYQTNVLIDSKIKKLDVIDKQYVKQFGFFLNNVTNNEISIANKMLSNAIMLNEIATNRRGGMFQQHIKDRGELTVLGGANIQRFCVSNYKGKVDKKYVNQQSYISPNSLLIQRIIAHIENPTEHIKITACIPELNEKTVIVDTVSQITLQSEINSKYIWCVLNSKLINWYAYSFIYGKAIRTMQFDNPVTQRIPVIKLLENEQQPFIEKADFLINKNKELQELKTKFLGFVKAELKPQKLSSKLQNYEELTWSEFKEELKKAKVNFEHFSVKTIREWQEEFEKEQQQLVSIKTIINQTDNDIDMMVYRLYGLDDTEINYFLEINHK